MTHYRTQMTHPISFGETPMSIRNPAGFRNVLIAFGLLLLGVVSSTCQAADQTSYPRMLKGKFGFAAQGYFGADFDAASQLTTGAYAVRVGVYTFDGKGNCSIHSMANKAGLGDAVEQDSTECTYEVYKDGTGKVDAVLGGKSFLTFFVLVNGGNEFMFTRREGINNPADQGGATLVYAVAKRQ